jgi:hypothetical protein
MTRFNIEDAAFAGVGLLARKPLAAFTWAIVWAILFALVTIPFAGPVTRYITLVAQSGGRPNTSSLLALAPEIGAFALLLSLGGLVVGAVVSCAVYRAVLEPEQSSFAYLRLGDQEIQVMLVNFVRGLILFLINIASSFVIAMFIIIVRGGGPGAVQVVQSVGEAVVFCLLFWVNIRFSLAGPMTYGQHRFRLFESWELTRGITLRLIAVGVIIFLIGLAVYFGVASLGAAGVIALWRSAPRPADLQTLLAQDPSIWLSVLAPFVSLISLMVLLAGALLTPIGVAPWPHIYQDLLGEQRRRPMRGLR